MYILCLIAAAQAAPPLLSSPLRAWRAGMTEPTRIALNADGDLFITDPTRGEILHRSFDGRLIGRQGGFEHPVSVAVASTGETLVGDAAAGTVTAWDGDWIPAFSVGEGFAFPSDIAIEPGTGRILVADLDRVQVLDSDGLHIFDIDGFGFAASVWSTGERILVVDASTWQVRVFDNDGVEQWAFGEWGTGDGELFKPLGVTVDEQGHIYVTDARTSEIEIFDAEGVWLSAIGGLGSAPGQLRTPTDLVVDPWGRLLVASANNARIEMFAMEGSTDPEAWVPGEASVQPASFSRDTGALTVCVELAGYRPSWASGVTVNGIEGSWESGDTDGDRIPEIVLQIDPSALIDTLDRLGRGTVTIAGTLTPPVGPALSFQEEVTVRVLATGQPDSGELDTAVDDTAIEDTAVEDTAVDDTAFEEVADDGAPSLEDDSPSSGCGCNGGAAGAGLLMLPWLVLRRRRS